MEEVIFDRLLDMASIDEECDFCWEDSSPISLKDVKTAISKGTKETSVPYGDTWKHPAHNMSRQYHLARIIYFANHPEEIAGIEVDNPCFENSILPGCVIVDGWHRIAAGIILKLKKVKINYGGRCDVEDYLVGKTDIYPDEILSW